MSIKKTISAGCCGNSGGNIIFYLDKTITNKVIPIFEAAGYIIPPHYSSSGIFYARKDNLVANGSYGTTKINIKVGAHDRDAKLAEFEKLLEEALNS